MLSRNRLQIARWIKSEFETMGFTNVEIDSFECHTQILTIKLPFLNRHIDTVTTQYNVIAKLTGSERPNDIYLICGHYDSFSQNSNMFVSAPGSDDNASGTTAVLIAAKAVMNAQYKPKATLKFVAFGAEELMYFGKSGSEYYVEKAIARQERIKFVVNNDMIGNSPDYPRNKALLIFQNTPMIANIQNICLNYSSLTLQVKTGGGSDFDPFVDAGYQGIYFEEGNLSHFYHLNTDVIGNMNLDFCTEVIKASCAVLLSMDGVISSQ